MPQIRRILVPVDFSDCSRLALEHAFDLAQAFGATVDALHVIEPVRYVQPGVIVATAEERRVPIEQFAQEYYETEMAQFLAEVPSDVKVQSRIEDGVPYDTIVHVAKDGGYDLIVLGTHGYTGLTHLVMGSVAERVVRMASCPVMTVRPTKKGD